MATNPTMTQYPAQVLNALNYYHRNGQYPLDDTSVWSTIEDFEDYISEAGSYRYPGQLVSITNGDPFSAANKKDVTLALVKPDGTVQKVGCELIFDSTGAAEAYVAANPEFAVAGKILTVKKSAGTGAANTYELYVINADKTLTRISFDQADIPEVTWDALTGKPTSAVADIDAAVTFSKKFQEIEEGAKLTYNGNQIAMVSDIPTTYDASKITGTIKLQNLPAGALERLYVADDEEARLALTTAEVQNGDVVKQEDTGTMYYVKDDTKLGSPDTAAQAFEVFTAGSATSVPWSGVTGTPTTLGGYGITDAVNSSEKAANYVEGGVVIWKNGTDSNTNTYQIEGKAKEAALADVATKALDSDKLGGQLPAYYAKQTDMDTVKGQIGESGTSGILKDIEDLKAGTTITAIAAEKITGVLSLDQLPKTVVERLTVVTDDEARLALTTEQVQNGDTVKVNETGKMYFVKDDTKLGSPETAAQAFEEYTVGTAGSVEWSGVLSKPTTLAGYGITDAVNSNEKVTVANAGNAGKILVLNAEGKLDADITGHVDWANINGKPTSSVTAIDQAVTLATHTNRDVLDKLTDVEGRLTYNGTGMATKPELDAISKSALQVVDVLPGDAVEGQLVLEKIS